MFNFYGTFLTGAREKRPRWKQCVASTDGDLGEALGKAFVEKTFGSEGKQRTLTMDRQIEAAMQQDLENVTRMSPETKKKALDEASDPSTPTMTRRRTHQFRPRYSAAAVFR